MVLVFSTMVLIAYGVPTILEAGTSDGQTDGGTDRHLPPPAGVRKERKLPPDTLTKKRKLPPMSKIQHPAAANNYSEFIFPGTLWCGNGDNANNDSDLGVFRRTDACCRTHDKCHPRMAGLTLRFGIMNWQPYTMMACKCDHEFAKCLSTINSLASRSVANVYFDVLQRNCFDMEVISKKHTCTKKSYWGLVCDSWSYRDTLVGRTRHLPPFQTLAQRFRAEREQIRADSDEKITFQEISSDDVDEDTLISSSMPVEHQIHMSRQTGGQINRQNQTQSSSSNAQQLIKSPASAGIDTATDTQLHSYTGDQPTSFTETLVDHIRDELLSKVAEKKDKLYKHLHSNRAKIVQHVWQKLWWKTDSNKQ